jgi:prolipoprotein diacylglyceryltransferase
MRQVLFHIPGVNLPIFGYGAMLVLAFFSCFVLAGWRAEKEGVGKEKMQDTAIWIFLFGLIGARITFMIQYKVPLTDIYKIWDGGLVFYGCLVGGAVGYVGAYFVILRKYNVSTWKMADIIAPCIPLGLAFGRLGCFLNGCCWGNVACTECPAVHFPMSSLARYDLVERGLQTAAGFVVSDEDDVARVAAVEPGSPAARADLKRGDIIVKANDQVIKGYLDRDKPRREDTLWGYMSTGHWPRGETRLALTVRRSTASDTSEEVELEPFEPHTLGLHPTQLYETISMIFLFLLLSAAYPFRPRYGSLMALFMLCYGVHRFLNEMLRKDTDPVAFGLTLSQNGSILLFLGGVALGVVLWLKPSLKPPAAGPAPA